MPNDLDPDVDGFGGIRTPLDAWGERVDRLYADLSTATLRDLRAALLLDIERGANRAFCHNRIAAIDRELTRRQGRE